MLLILLVVNRQYTLSYMLTVLASDLCFHKPRALILANMHRRIFQLCIAICECVEGEGTNDLNKHRLCIVFMSFKVLFPCGVFDKYDKGKTEMSKQGFLSVKLFYNVPTRIGQKTLSNKTNRKCSKKNAYDHFLLLMNVKYDHYLSMALAV